MVSFTPNTGLDIIKSLASHYGKFSFGLPFALKGTSWGGRARAGLEFKRKEGRIKKTDVRISLSLGVRGESLRLM